MKKSTQLAPAAGVGGGAEAEAEAEAQAAGVEEAGPAAAPTQDRILIEMLHVF